tara:strand:+ start:34 stop:507 length:474 start_codon:yes stop_codon:yes gene_type:complete
MKSFKRFNEDAYAGRQGTGAFLTGKALELGARGVRKGYKAVTSFASLVGDFNKKRKAEKEYKDAVNKGIQNVRDPEADKLAADAAKDADLGKLDRRPPDGSTPKDTSPEFQDTMRGLKRGKNLDSETKLERIRKATGEYKKWKSKGGQGNKGNKPKK